MTQPPPEPPETPDESAGDPKPHRCSRLPRGSSHPADRATSRLAAAGEPPPGYQQTAARATSSRRPATAAAVRSAGYGQPTPRTAWPPTTPRPSPDRGRAARDLPGGFGVHRFYLGFTKIGVIQIIVTIFTCGIGSLWGFVEGILYLVGANLHRPTRTGARCGIARQSTRSRTTASASSRPRSVSAARPSSCAAGSSSPSATARPRGRPAGRREVGERVPVASRIPSSTRSTRRCSS